MNHFETNRKLWNELTDIHFQSDFYNVEKFIQGESSLNSIELELFGDLKNKKVLHLQCHFGMDSISLARLGAEVTAVDQSDKSIEKAEELNKKAGTNVKFIRNDIYSLTDTLNEQFDFVFTSYGALCWLPDLPKWSEIVSRYIKPNGNLIVVEFHPFLDIYSDDFKRIEYGYFEKEPFVYKQQGTYTNPDADIKHESVNWNHSLSEIMNSIINNRMEILDFQEFDYSPYNCFPNMTETEKGKYRIKDLEGKIPMIYSIKARKKL